MVMMNSTNNMATSLITHPTATTFSGWNTGLLTNRLKEAKVGPGATAELCFMDRIRTPSSKNRTSLSLLKDSFSVETARANEPHRTYVHREQMLLSMGHYLHLIARALPQKHITETTG